MKKIILSLSIAIIVSFVVFPVTVNAMIVNSKGNVTIAADETIDDDLFIAGETVTIRGVINGDVYAAGGTVDIDGVVNGDVLAAGGMVTISGQIKDDVRVAGGQVTISNAIIGDNERLQVEMFQLIIRLQLAEVYLLELGIFLLQHRLHVVLLVVVVRFT